MLRSRRWFPAGTAIVEERESSADEVDDGSLRERPSSKSVRVALTKWTMVPCGNSHRRRA
ncbi:hypothetical protein H8B09_01800 [Paenibacillus sp. PR3]|uniref:Uncharacterized protein n=1 Tax=Paenibacillus terricola TaxID=2763503 RepID=A0ABR8MN80_9BACL|nr:hypothetical protein [Paenibacillus terricola]MBD3917473.1 hypothetical protein [Paenibacillus terricola]